MVEKNNWCPLIKDFCRGPICVCYKDTAFGEPVHPRCAYLDMAKINYQNPITIEEGAS